MSQREMLEAIKNGESRFYLKYVILLITKVCLIQTKLKARHRNNGTYIIDLLVDSIGSSRFLIKMNVLETSKSV